MQSVPLLSLLAAAVLTGSAVSAPAELLWPMPVASSCTGAPLPLGRQFSIAASSAVTPLLQRTIDRYIALIPVGPAAPATGGLDVLLVGVTGAGDGDPALSKDTDYSYAITVTAVNGTGGPMASYTRPPGSTTIHHRATITAGSVYGVMAGLESFSQLAGQAATLPCSRVSLTDRPAFRHRGLMLDTGRRHFPVALLKIILEGMAAAKLNVLHLHLSDFGGFRVASPTYPALTATLLDKHGARLYWLPQEVEDIVAFAGERGIRVIPEVDLPGHSAGFYPLEGPDGVQFCSNRTASMLPSQLFDDAEGRTFKVLSTVLSELFPLFPDTVFHLGADETGRDVSGDVCSKLGKQQHSNAAQIELKLQKLVSDNGKQPYAWEEMLTETEVARTGTIIAAWSKLSAAEATFAGYEAVECDGSRFYLDHPKGESPSLSWSNYTPYWSDIAPSCPPGTVPTRTSKCFHAADTAAGKAQRRFMLGGETSFWSDHYCPYFECHATTGGPAYPRGCAWYLSGADPALASVFAQSAVAMIFPRTSIAAGAYWNRVPGLGLARGGEVWARLSAFSAHLASRGVTGCPAFDPAAPCPQGCSEAAMCGRPYPGAPHSPFPLEKHCPYHE